MYLPALWLCLISGSISARVYLNEPDTGIDESFNDVPVGTLPDISRMLGIPDFDWAARHFLNTSIYTQFRYGAGGEWSYRNNLEIFKRFRLRPRVLVDVTNVESTLNTSILDYQFSAPLVISPCANAGMIHPEAERGLVEAAQRENILYVPSQTTSITIEDIAAFKPADGSQVVFQQVSLTGNITATQVLFQRIESLGAKAIVFTVDSAADRTRQRALRYVTGNITSRGDTYLMTWDYYKQLSNMTSLPIIPKGIQTVEDARLSVQMGAKAIILSNHGGRQLDGSSSPLEVALEIYSENPEIFSQVEVYADGGVRYGTDVLKLLALGVKAVGLGRPFMFANAYGTEGVVRAIQLLKREIAVGAGSLGVQDLKQINASYASSTASTSVSRS